MQPFLICMTDDKYYVYNFPHMSLLTILILSQSLQAAMLKHEISKPSFKEFEFPTVCEEMGAKNNVLISPKSLMKIECLNKTYPLIDFCLKKFPLEKNLTRGFVDTAKKKVVCEFSDSVMISVSCDKRDLKYCFDPKKGCIELGKVYAHRLEVAHYSMLAENLNCYYSKTIGESLE